GLVGGGASSRLRPVLQPGNRISATGRARLDEHLGHYVVESLDARAASFLPVPHALYGMTHLAALCRLLPERDPHPQIHAALEEVLDALLDPRRAGAGVVRFELLLLAELGFGLDLSACAASGAADDLVYVAPKSGRAVARRAVEGPAVAAAGVSARGGRRRSLAAGRRRWLHADGLLPRASRARAARARPCRRARELHRRARARRSRGNWMRRTGRTADRPARCPVIVTTSGDANGAATTSVGGNSGANTPDRPPD